jgi:hypothetical protein
MPTGPTHERLISAEFDGGGNLTRVELEDCRCMIGSNHDDDGNEVDDWQDLENDGHYDPDERGMCENIVHGGDRTTRNMPLLATTSQILSTALR